MIGDGVWAVRWRDGALELLDQRVLPEREEVIRLETAADARLVVHNQNGGHLLIGKDRQAPAETDGWVTSACFSPNLERYIALGVLRAGRDRDGEILTVCDEDRRFNVKVVSPVFYDPDNERLRH